VPVRGKKSYFGINSYFQIDGFSLLFDSFENIEWRQNA